MNEQDELHSIPPLKVLFEKPTICNPKISPNGKYLVWLERDPSRKVLNFRASIFDHDKSETNELDSRQLSFFDDYDACTYYTFSSDDRYILFLREPILGKEMYHLYTIELSQAMNCDWSYSSWEYICRTPDPKLTCAIGFIGGIQLWVTKNNPDVVILATGNGALFWDLSELNLSTNELRIIQRNPIQLKSWYKNFTDCFNLLTVVCRTVGNMVGSYLLQNFLGITNLVEPARVPVEWYLDAQTLEVKGKNEVSFEVPKLSYIEGKVIKSWRPLLHISVSCLFKSRWKCIDTIALEDLNMNLVGAGGGTGTARVDFIDEFTVDIHGCRKGDNFTRYERVDLRDLTKSETIAQATDSDITRFFWNPHLNRIDAVGYENDRIRISPLRSGDQANGYEKLERAFQRRMEDKLSLTSDPCESRYLPSIIPLSRTADNKTWIVYAFADQGNIVCDNCPEAYFIFKNEDLEDDQLSLWKLRRPNLKPFSDSLGSQNSLRVTTRDGKEILCFLSVPSKNTIGDKNMIPLVVHPHGGPNWRDQWGYDPMLQALTTQGYAVLQIEYRGSTGFGMDFMKDGMNGEFCAGVQQDIIDSVHHVLENIVIRTTNTQIEILKETRNREQKPGYITCDPNRVAILGGSFGGYCSLFGVTLLHPFQPRFQYRCGVAFAALYSVGAAAASSFRGDPLVKAYWRRLYGDKISDDLCSAKAASPAYHVQNVKVPLLISHGENDPRCPIEVANKFCEKLSEKGLVRYIVYPGEGHGLRKEANILHNWMEVLKFLRKSLSDDEKIQQFEDSVDNLNHSAKMIYFEKEQ